MELYILSKQDLSILSICKLADYQINLDEETNAKSTFTLMKTNGLKKGNYMTLNGLYRQFIFVIDDVQTEKGSNVVTVTALDISNIFDRKVIEKNIDTMKSKSIEEFLANTISENFVNSDDTALNVNYIEIYWHTNTKGNVATNSENGLYNFHTFLTNCRQYKNIYTDFKLENLGNPQTVEGKRISVEAKNRKIIDISLHGESTQSGTPTPENKVDIENIEGNIEFKVEGKNRFNPNNIVNLALGHTIVAKANYRGYYMPCNQGDIFSISRNSLSNNRFRVVFTNTEPANGVSFFGGMQASTYDNLLKIENIIAPENANYIFVYLSNQADTLPTEIQLEKNSTATDYEPYKSQVVTFPLGEEKLMKGSYLADDGIHHRRKQVVLDATETWQLEGVNAYTKMSDARGTINSIIISNQFKYEVNSSVWGQIRFGRTNNNLIIYDVVTEKGSLANFKTWLVEQCANGTPVIVEYELAEPEIVPYTVEQQEAWNNIKNLTLFEGVNHISSDANMVLKYYPLEPVGLKFILRIDIENKQETTELIDTTLPEVTDYNKIYEEDVTAKVQVYIREDGSEYNLYLKTDRTTTTNKDDPDRASGKIEVISVETADNAPEEALNVMKGNNYKHLVEFKIAKTSKLMDITELHIGRPIKIKTDDDIYDSYISAITLSDENFVYFKSGSLRITLLDKLKQKFLQIT